MKKAPFLPGKRIAMISSVILAVFISFGSLKAVTVITSLTIGTQSNSVTYGVAGSVTFPVYFTKSGTGPGLTRLTINWVAAGGGPAGAIASFPVTPYEIDPETATSPVTVTITTTANTPPSTSGFTVSSTSYAITTEPAYLVVGRKALTLVGAAASNKVYDGNNSATITGALSGIIGADMVYFSGTGIFVTWNVGSLIGVTSTGTLTGVSASKYTLIQPTGLTANITPKSLNISGLSGGSKVYDGTRTATVNGSPSPSGLIVGDVVNITGTPVLLFSDPQVGTGKPITATGYTLGGPAAVNYQVVQPTGLTGSITRKTLTITGLAGVNKVYDGGISASATGTPVLSGIVAGEPGTLILSGSAVFTFASASVGMGKPITVTGYIITGTASGNYTLIQPTGLTANITARALTVASASASNKVYDATNVATVTGSLAGIIGTDVVTLVGSGTFASVNIGTGIAVTSTSTLGGASAGNYSLTQPTGLTANITAKGLTISSAAAASKQYDGNASAVITGTLNGVAGNDVITFTGTGNFNNASIGTGKPVTATCTLSGAKAGNYTLTQPTGLTANITSRALTITGLAGANKVYDGTTTATTSGTATLSGVISGDVVSLLGPTGVNFASSSVGEAKPITIIGYTLTGAQAGNYTVSQPTGLIANITAKPLTISTPVANSKVYDGTNAAIITGTLTGVVAGDAVTFVGTGTFVSTAVGTDITVTSTCTLSGAQASNYTLTQPTGLKANITGKPLTMTGASAANKIYDRTNTATVTGTLSGVLGADIVVLTGSGTFATVNVANGIAVTSTSTISGANAGNYTLTQPTGLTANITPRSITITGLAGVDRVYNGTTSATTTGTAVLNGVLPADVLNVVLGGTPGANFVSSSVGTGKAITVAGYSISGSAAGNYSLLQPTGVTANITAKTITVASAAVVSRVYTGTNGATITGILSGIVVTDDVVLVGTGYFTSINVGNGISVVSTSTLGGTTAGNYTLTQPTGLTGNITPRPLSITATGPMKIYGTSLSAGPNSTDFTTFGTVGSETVLSVTLRPNAEGLLALTSAGSTYVVTPSLAIGTVSFLISNYDITYVPYTGIVSPKPITITVDAGQRKLFGTSDPVFTYSCSPALIGSDAFTGSLSRVAGETVEGSPYAITRGTLTAGANYTASFVQNFFTITPTSDALMSAFNFTLLPNYPETINQTTGTISLSVKNTANLPALVANFTVSPGAVVKVGGVVQTSGVTPNNFNGAVNYVVTSANGLTSKIYTVTVSKNAILTDKQLLSFSFAQLPDAVGVINQSDYSVTVHVPLTYNVTNLVATFTLSPLATATTGSDVQQVSGVSSNNFTAGLTTGFVYTIHAENGSTRNYYIYLVRDPARSERQMLTYSLQGIAGAIDESAHTIGVTIPNAFNITSLVAVFTTSLCSTVRIGTPPEAVIQLSGTTVNSFVNPLTYTIVAENGVIQDYVVYVTQLAPSNAKQITAFQFDGLSVPAIGVIDEAGNIILDTIPFNANIRTLKATFTKSPLATVTVNGINQESGITANNFLNDVIYNVIAEDNSQRIYTVRVTQRPAGRVNQLLTFSVSISGEKVNGVISEADRSVFVEVPYGTNLTNLVASFTVSNSSIVKIGETTQVNGVTVNNFTLPKVYRIVAEDGSTELYTVVVRSVPVFLTFSFDDLPTQPVGVIDMAAGTVLVHIPNTISKSAVKAYFTVSDNAEVSIEGTVQSSGVTVNDFRTDKTYTLKGQNGSVQDFHISVINDPVRTDKKILAYSFNELDPPCSGVINDTTKMVTVNVPYGTNLSELKATFTLSEMASAKVGLVAQVSGQTVNNFNSDVVYTIAGENASTQNYSVRVISAASPEKRLLSFQLLGFASPVIGVINEDLKTVVLHVPAYSGITNLVAAFTLSANATAKVNNVLQTSGVTVNDFTSQVTYIVYGQDGSYVNYRVTVIVDLNNQKQFLAFSFDDISPKPIGIIDENNLIIRVGIPFTVSRSSLRAFFTVSPGASVFINGAIQQSGISVRNFSADTVFYRVVAEDLTTRDYKVVVRNNPIERGKEILTYRFNSVTPASEGIIDATLRTIVVHVPFGTNLSNLVATFTTSPRARLNVGAIEQISGVTLNNYVNPLTIVVSAEDGTSQTYWVTVTVDPNTEKKITLFKFASLAPVAFGVVDETAKRVDVAVPYNTNVTNLVATFTTSANAWMRIGEIYQNSGITANDFTNPINYQVVAQDGSTQDYLVVVTVLPNTEKKFLSFQIDNLVPPSIGVINEALHTIQLKVPFSNNKTSLIVSFTVSVNAMVFLDGVQQVSPGAPVSFSSTRIYTVRAGDGSMQNYSVSVSNNAPETGNSILSYKFLQFTPEVVCAIDQTAKTITGTLPYGATLTSLIPTFEKSYMSVVTVGPRIQESGVTANDFTNGLVYKCIAEDGNFRNYTVSVAVTAPSALKDISYFAFEDIVPACVGVINQINRIITINVPAGTNLNSLRATFNSSDFSTVTIVGKGLQTSGVSYNEYALPVIYRVLAQDGTTQDYTVIVNLSSDTTAPVVFNTIQTASNSVGQFVAVQSSEATGKVYIIKDGAPQVSVANLDASVAAGLGRSSNVNQANTDVNVSTSGLEYGIYYAYAVDAAGNKSEKGVNPITVNDLTPPAVFVTGVVVSNSPSNSVNVRSSESKGYVYLIKDDVQPRITKSDLDRAVGALKGQKAAVMAANADVPISVSELKPGNYHAFAVDSHNNISAESENMVVVTQASTIKTILNFSFNGFNPPALGQINGTSITVRVQVGTPLTSLIATFTLLSPKSRVYVGLVEQTSGSTPNNFTNTVIYKVEAEDGSTLDYTVTVSYNTFTADQEWGNTIKVYPNPVSDRLTIEMSQVADRIMIVNALGQTMTDLQEVGSNTVIVETGLWSKGIYLIRFYNSEKFLGVWKVIKN
jgi:hypothetical protein